MLKFPWPASAPPQFAYGRVLNLLCRSSVPAVCLFYFALNSFFYFFFLLFVPDVQSMLIVYFNLPILLILHMSKTNSRINSAGLSTYACWPYVCHTLPMSVQHPLYDYFASWMHSRQVEHAKMLCRLNVMSVVMQGPLGIRLHQSFRPQIQ